MAIRIRLTRPTFEIDFAPATNHEIEDPVTVHGFIGDWKNPLYLVIALGAEHWAISMDEVEEQLVSCFDAITGLAGERNEDADNLDDGSFDVWFVYKGTDQALIDRLRAWDETGRGGEERLRDRVKQMT